METKREKTLNFFKFFVLSIFLVVLNSCSHLEHGSGNYIQIGSNESLGSISKKHRVSVSEIKRVNSNSRFRSGDWIYIPKKKGLLDILYYSKRNEIEIISGEVAYFSKGNKNKFMWPVPSSRVISSFYGHRGGRPHQGIDIPGKYGSSIVSIANGKVIYSGRGISGYGNMTIIDHGNGYHSVYAHAQKNYTSKGDRVYKGQVIAKVGSTGRSTGPHLHFEIRYKNIPRNPIVYYPKHPIYKRYYRKFARR